MMANNLKIVANEKFVHNILSFVKMVSKAICCRYIEMHLQVGKDYTAITMFLSINLIFNMFMYKMIFRGLTILLFFISHTFTCSLIDMKQQLTLSHLFTHFYTSAADDSWKHPRQKEKLIKTSNSPFATMISTYYQ